jgi:hypothetical protein
MNVMDQWGFDFEVPHKSQVIKLEARERFMGKKNQGIMGHCTTWNQGLTRSNVKFLTHENNWNYWNNWNN